MAAGRGGEDSSRASMYSRLEGDAQLVGKSGSDSYRLAVDTRECACSCADQKVEVVSS